MESGRVFFAQMSSHVHPAKRTKQAVQRCVFQRRPNPQPKKTTRFPYRVLSNPWSIHATIFTFYMVLPGVASSWCSISPKQHVRRSAPRLPAPIRGSDHNRSRYATHRPLWTSCEPTTPGTVMLATWRGNWHGGFLKWRYPNSWMVYKGNSHYIKWMTWGFPYFRKP